MDWGTVIAALASGVLALIGVLISNSSSSKLTAYKIDELKTDTAGKIADLKSDTAGKIADLKGDFAELKTKVEKHNNLVERMAIVEQQAKSAHHRLDEIKGGH